MKKYPLQEYATDLLLCWLFAFSLLWGAFQSLQYDFSAAKAALLLFAFALVWLLILRVKWAAIIFGAGLFLFILVFELTMPLDQERTQLLFYDWNQWGLWVGEAIVHNIYGPPEYLDRALTLMSLGAALISGALVRTRTHPVVFLLLGGGLFFTQEYFMGILFIPAFFLFLCALALYMLRQSHVKRRKRAHKTVPPLRALAGALPLCLLAVGLSLLLPSSDTALGQPFMDWAGSLGSGGGGPQELNLSHFSYGDLKKRDGGDELGGPLRQNKALLLRVWAEHPGYLKAHTYDTYTGRSWTTNDSGWLTFKRLYRPTEAQTDADNQLTLNVGIPAFLPPEYGALAGGYSLLSGAILRAHLEMSAGNGSVLSPVLDKLLEADYAPPGGPNFSFSVDGALYPQNEAPPGYSISIASMDMLSAKPDAVRYGTQRITFQDLRSDALYLPWNAVDVREDEEVSGAEIPGCTLSMLGDMKMRSDQGKSFTYWVETCDLDLNKDELGDLLRLSGLDLFNGLDDSNGGVLATLCQDAMWERGYAFFDQTPLPDTVPERVYTLAHNLTDDQPTDYDKALAVETWLRRTFPYDTDVPATPPGRDFVDYFLFDLKKGYCTYYATAMTVLCRAVGLPARYVEGFVPVADKANPGEYTVTGEEAHAWCEVFFTGFGWVPFDPTASLGAVYEDRIYNQTAPPEAMPTPTPYQPLNIPSPSLTPTPAANPPAAHRGWTPPAWLLVLIGVIVILCAVPIAQSVRRGRLRRGRHAPRHSARILYSRVVRLGTCLGVPKPALSETPLEWAIRADETLEPGTNASFLPAMDFYGKLTFGPARPSADDIVMLYALYDGLTARWRGDISRITWFVFRHYLGWL